MPCPLRRLGHHRRGGERQEKEGERGHHRVPYCLSRAQLANPTPRAGLSLTRCSAMRPCAGCTSASATNRVLCRAMSIVRALSNDPLVQGFSKLSSCNISDALDRLHVNGAPHRILPLWSGCPKIVGRAATLQLVDHGSQSPIQGTM